MQIQLPSRLTARQYWVALGLASKIIQTDESEVVLDATNLKFIDPFCLSLLASIGSDHAKLGGTIRLVNLSSSISSYLSRMDFFQQPWFLCDEIKKLGRSDQRHSLVELVEIINVSDVDSSSQNLAHAILGSIPGLSEGEEPDEMTGYRTWDKASEPLCHAFTEVLQNSLTHAHRNGFRNSSVWVSAQYYSNTDDIYIGIVDNGCGMLSSLENHPKLTSKDDETAILLALQPRISCNREVGLYDTATNAGIGLTTTYRIARESRGSMLIVSGKSAIRAVQKHEAQVIDANLPSWQGVAISLRLERSAMMAINLRDLMPAREIGREAPTIRFE